MKEKFDVLSKRCSRATTRLYSTSFSLGIYFLEKEIREAVCAIYGFVRLADEIVDSFHDYDKTELLAEFRTDCNNSLIRKISLNPVLNSFQAVVHRYKIDYELIDQFLVSMEMDLAKKDYSKELYDQYIFGSAQVVGLMCLRVFTNGNETEYEKLKIPAMKLGAAFQKVNFLRDVRADFEQLGRNYFPGIEMPHLSDHNKKTIEHEILQEFDAALSGISQLPDASRKGVYLAYVYYKKLLTKIVSSPAENILSARIRISNGHKLLIMANSLIRYKLRLL